MAARDGDTVRWKHKYYHSLEDLERKEQHWARAQSSLHRALGRLALSAYGAHPSVDRRLDELREAIRAGRDAEELVELVTRVHRACEQAGIATREPAPPRPTRELRELLLGMLGEIRFSPALEARARGLRAQLSTVEEETALRTLVKEVNALLRAALTSQTEPPPPARSKPAGSLMRRLFSARDGETDDEPELLARELVGEFLTHVERTFDVGPALGPLRERLGGGGLVELERVLQEATALACASAREPANAERPGRQRDDDSNETQAPIPVEDALQALIGALDLPEDLQERRDGLREGLESPLTPPRTLELIEAVASLVSELNARTREERTQMQAFLSGITDRLQELDGFFNRHAVEQGESRDAGQALRASFGREVRGIEQQVSTATDLERLKQEVHSRIATIGQHLEAFLDSEDRRHQRFEGEISYLSNALSRTEGETENLRARLEQAQARAMRDGLTGLYNRAAFDERVGQEHARWQRHGEPLSLLIWDLDHFKALNDSLGHQAGDKILRTVAQLVAKRVRTSDFVARYGGEEFVALLPATDAPGARRLAESVRAVVAETSFRYHGERVTVTLSCGVATFTEGDDPRRVLQRADDALYRAKENGRDRVEVAED